MILFTPISDESKELYREWLTDFVAKMPLAHDHKSSPLVWIQDSEDDDDDTEKAGVYIGGRDSAVSWAKAVNTKLVAEDTAAVNAAINHRV
jgi:hypothetical protein